MFHYLQFCITKIFTCLIIIKGIIIIKASDRNNVQAAQADFVLMFNSSSMLHPELNGLYGQVGGVSVGQG